MDCLPCIDSAVPLWLEVEHALLPHASSYTALQTLVRQGCRSKCLRRLLKAFTTQANTDSLHQHVDRPPAGPGKEDAAVVSRQCGLLQAAPESQ